MLTRVVQSRIARYTVAPCVLALIVACGPPLTDPSSQNVTGSWSTTDHVGVVYDISLNLTQDAGGKITGEWAGKVSSPNATCPPEIGTAPTGPVTGTNTVIGISLSVLGAGEFRGQVISPTEMRGSFESCAFGYEVTFSLRGPAPGG
jgi:hypothetical protein